MEIRGIDILKVMEVEKQMFKEGIAMQESFPDWIEIQVIYPFCGAAARFRARNKNDHNKYVSVYLDIHQLLGFYDNRPYWEVYPDSDGDTFRCGKDETKILIDKICELLK